MKPTNVFHKVNQQVSRARASSKHRNSPKLPFKMVVDQQATLMVFMTKREYLDFLETRDTELCNY